MLDSSAALQSTRAVQLCLLISGVVSSALLTAENLTPDYVAGLSIGAWSAAVVAGVLALRMPFVWLPIEVNSCKTPIQQAMA